MELMIFYLSRFLLSSVVFFNFGSFKMRGHQLPEFPNQHSEAHVSELLRLKNTDQVDLIQQLIN